VAIIVREHHRERTFADHADVTTADRRNEETRAKQKRVGSVTPAEGRTVLGGSTSRIQRISLSTGGTLFLTRWCKKRQVKGPATFTVKKQMDGRSKGFKFSGPPPISKRVPGSFGTCKRHPPATESGLGGKVVTATIHRAKRPSKMHPGAQRGPGERLRQTSTRTTTDQTAANAGSPTYQRFAISEGDVDGPAPLSGKKSQVTAVESRKRVLRGKYNARWEN